MHNKKNAAEILTQLISVLESNLSELTSVKYKDDYTLGSWEASIDCLEIIGCWSRAKYHGLDYNPEVKYNIYK